MDLLSTVLGLGIGAGMSAGARALRDYRSDPVDPADLLNWAYLVDPGVILMKDGSFLAGWRYRGPDTAAATDEELALLSTHINEGLLPFTDRWMLHVDAVRRPASGYAQELSGGFPEPITGLIDSERRVGYESTGQFFETEHGRHRRPVNVAIEQTDLRTVPRQADGEHGRDRALAYTALARAHRDDVLDVGQRALLVARPLIGRPHVG